MQSLDILDWELEEALKNPHTVHHDFATRMNVWVTQIIPNRIEAVLRERGEAMFVHRMITLTTADAERLRMRAYREVIESGGYDTYLIRVEDVFFTLVAAIKIYQNGGNKND